MPLLRPADSPLRCVPPSLQQLAYLLQLCHICSNSSLLRGGLPLRAKASRLCAGLPLRFLPCRCLRFGLSLCLNPRCLHPFQSFYLGPTPRHCPSPCLLLPCIPLLLLNPNVNLVGISTTPVLDSQPLHLGPSHPDFYSGRRIRIPLVISVCCPTPSVYFYPLSQVL